VVIKKPPERISSGSYDFLVSRARLQIRELSQYEDHEEFGPRDIDRQGVIPARDIRYCPRKKIPKELDPPSRVFVFEIYGIDTLYLFRALLDLVFVDRGDGGLTSGRDIRDRMRFKKTISGDG
jgi:hypothetical protein